MELVVDANVLFSAAIKDGGTAALLLRDDLDLYAPEFLFEEFRKYRDVRLEKTHREPREFERFVRILEGRITTCPRDSFEVSLSSAEAVSPDPKDVPYVALAMARSARIWSDDSALRGQDAVSVVTTTDLVEALEPKGNEG